MQKEILIHISLPCARNDQLIKSLRSRWRFFSQFGVYTPDPNLYRTRLERYLSSTDDRVMTETGRNAFWSRIGEPDCSRVILSISRSNNLPHSVFGNTGLLPDLNSFARRMLHFFKGNKIKLLIGVVNPRDLLLSMAKYGVDLDSISRMADLYPGQFWSDALGACIDELPEISIEAWQHETSHLSWSGVLRRVGNVRDNTFIPGSIDMAAELLRYDDLKRILDHVRRIPPQNDYHCEKIVYSYVKRPFLIEKNLPKPDVFGWSSEFVRGLDENYEHDLEALRSDKDINFIC